MPHPDFGSLPNHPGAYVYRIRSTGSSSAKFGPCEVCGKHVSETFIQTEGITYENGGRIAVTHHECITLFGHEECLIAKRRN